MWRAALTLGRWWLPPNNGARPGRQAVFQFLDELRQPPVKAAARRKAKAPSRVS
jgi:hypothetical protein